MAKTREFFVRNSITKKLNILLSDFFVPNKIRLVQKLLFLLSSSFHATRQSLAQKSVADGPIQLRKQNYK